MPIANEIRPRTTKNNQYFFKGFQPSSPDEYLAIIPKNTINKDDNIVDNKAFIITASTQTGT